MPEAKRPGRKAYLWISLVALGLVLLPFLFWYQTWFGRALSPSDLDHLLTNTGKPRETQHALVQVGERMGRGEDASRWYPAIIALVDSPNRELRQTTAWIMGQDTRHAPFGAALHKLLRDPEPLVRRNAALGLAKFTHQESREELRGELRNMLRPYTVVSPTGGLLKLRLQPGEYVNAGTLLARIGETEVRSPLPGEIRAFHAADGTEIKIGQPLADLSADKDHAWEALRALLLVGEAADIEDVQRYARGVANMPPQVQQQAALTLREIQSRVR
ncbi:MAG: HEAT repeat domain-containing protein [Bryobacteraceae bacterium]